MACSSMKAYTKYMMDKIEKDYLNSGRRYQDAYTKMLTEDVEELIKKVNSYMEHREVHHGEKKLTTYKVKKSKVVLK